MSVTTKAKRFRVALSFPREHRGRVEKIAEALAGRLTRERVLYDWWYGAGFTRPNLDVYLPKLYYDESDFIVFLCEAYDKRSGVSRVARWPGSTEAQRR